VTCKTQKKLEDHKNINVKDTHMTRKGKKNGEIPIYDIESTKKKNKILAYDIEDTITPP
jgi:hypothetical protein